MEFTDRIAHVQDALNDYYDGSKYLIPDVEYEIDDFDILINIKVYSCKVTPTELKLFNYLVGKEYHHIESVNPYNPYDDYGIDPYLSVVYKF